MLMQIRVIDGVAYLTQTDTSWTEPELVTLYWKTEAPAMIELDNLFVQMMGAAYYIHAFGKNIPCNPVEVYPSKKSVLPLTRPSKRHVWKNGEWRKS